MPRRRPLLPFLAAAFALGSPLAAQKPLLEVEVPTFEVPSYVMERLAPSDKLLFAKLAEVGLEAVWAQLTNRGYTECFINELDAVQPDRRLIGRARTIRYLPTRPDLRDKIYAQRQQLNYVSAEEAEPGDVLVFDAGGDTRSAVSGGVTTLRFLVKGGNGMIIDGGMRDLPELATLPFQVYMRRGQAAAVRPHLMSVDYQVPVRIGNVTVVPGDILLGDRHGILVIPAHLAEEVVDEALAKSDFEEFQRELLLSGRPIYGVYPPSEATKKEYEQWKNRRGAAR